VFQKQKDQPVETNLAQDNMSDAPQSVQPAAPEAGGWTTRYGRICAVVAVGVVALGCGAVYQHLQAQVTELRNEVGTLTHDLHRDLEGIGTSYAAMVKKADYDSRFSKLFDVLKELRADRNDLTTLKERCAGLLESCKSADAERRRLRDDLARLSERRAGEEEKRELASEIRALRLRIAELEKPVSKPYLLPAGHVDDPRHP
jgi:DNA repair exonuclease SbcCD ATPase subunit